MGGIDPEQAAKSRPSSAGSESSEDGYGVIEDLRTTSIFASLSTLLFSEKFSDMAIRCAGREFKAHRAIICPQSSFFDKALTNGFSVSTASYNIILFYPESQLTSPASAN